MMINTKFNLSGYSVELEQELQSEMSIFTAFIHDNVKSAIPKERSELTQNEEFALAYSAGVRVNSYIDENGYWKQQTEPVGIIKDGDKWVVLTKNNGWILNV
jgi:hypothetical protein